MILLSSEEDYSRLKKSQIWHKFKLQIMLNQHNYNKIDDENNK